MRHWTQGGAGEIEGESTEAGSGFKEGNISHLVYATITPILRDFHRRTGGETGGVEDLLS